MKVIYKNTQDDGPNNIDGPTKISDTNNPNTNVPKSNPTNENDTKSWLRNGNVQKGLVTGTILLIFLMGAYNYKKCLLLFK